MSYTNVILNFSIVILSPLTVILSGRAKNLHIEILHGACPEMLRVAQHDNRRIQGDKG